MFRVPSVHPAGAKRVPNLPALPPVASVFLSLRSPALTLLLTGFLLQSNILLHQKERELRGVFVGTNSGGTFLELGGRSPDSNPFPHGCRSLTQAGAFGIVFRSSTYCDVRGPFHC